METKKVTYDPVFEIFRLNKALETIENTIQMIRDGRLYIHFEMRDVIIKELYSSKFDVNKAIEVYFKELEEENNKVRKAA